MRISKSIAALAAACCVWATAVQSPATTVRELTRIKGEGQFMLSGLGLVAGLRGTGDDGKELAVARPMAALYREFGNELASPKEFAKAKSVALVWVTCTIPDKGARADDRLDVVVSTIYSASTLVGGHLVATALKGSLPGQKAIMLAEGAVELEDTALPTNGRVREGGRMFEDFLGPKIEDTFDLIIDAPFAGWSAASQIAIAVNGKADPINNAAAVAIDERIVRITIPAAERTDRAAFLADVFQADVNPSLLDLPAQVVVNQRLGAIIVTGDVQIRPVAITQKDLSITTITNPAETAKLADVIAAFRQLNIPVSEQVNILQMLRKSGQLHARIVID